MSSVTSDVKVAGLYNIADLQRLCKKENIQVSKETNRYLLFLTVTKLGPSYTQKLVKLLVDKGEIEWDEEENFEVESILDHRKDEGGVDFYHIKWRGWSSKHNTWEPRDNLSCDQLVEEFHAVNKEDGIDHTIINRRKYTKEDAGEVRHQMVKDLMERILAKSKDITPLTLLNVSSERAHMDGYSRNRLLGLTHNGSAISKAKLRAGLGGSKFRSKKTKVYRQLHADTKAALKKWEAKLNHLNTDPAPIRVINDVDLEGPPDKFEYISDYKVGEGIEIPSDPLVGCECQECYNEKKQCCSKNAGADFAYYKTGRVRIPPGHPIYECNKRCQCGSECSNRVVQYGRKIKVAIFRTNNNRGWGVKAMQKVKKGSFVMEYIGEVITNKEAERRGKVYDAEGMTYLFDLDYNDSDEIFCVDAGFYGNISHFVNHSCDPNMAVYGVWINHLDPRLPRIALFARRDIKAGEELTFDYMMTGDTTHQVKTPPPVGVEQQDVKPAPFIVPGKTSMLSPVSSKSKLGASPSPVISMDVDEDLMGPPLAVTAVTPTKEDSAKMSLHSLNLKNQELLDSEGENGFSDKASDITTSERSEVTSNLATSETSGSELNMSCGEEMGFFRRTLSSPSPALRYRIRCQCGAKTCRQYLY